MRKAVAERLNDLWEWMVVDNPVITVGLVALWLAYVGYRNHKVASYKAVLAARLMALTRREAAGVTIDFDECFRTFPRIPREPVGWLKRRGRQMLRWVRRVAMCFGTPATQRQRRSSSRLFQHRIALAVPRPEIGTFDVLTMWLSGTSKMEVINSVFVEHQYKERVRQELAPRKANVFRLSDGSYLFIEPALLRHRLRAPTS